jgi:hypothetical protein
MNKNYDHSWDFNDSGKGKVAVEEDAYDRKHKEWERRDWMPWLSKNLTFPFTVTREEDVDADFFEGRDTKTPFGLGHTMEILGLDFEDDSYGVIVKAREKGRIGRLPLCDLEVKPKTDKNYWPVQEYVVWFANH